MSRKLIFLVLVVLLVGPVAKIVCAATITETFDSDLGNFDTAVNNRTNGNDWGWSNTSNAGGIAGELGGREKRTGDDYVCDATLGGSLTENDAIIMRGKGWLRNDDADGVFFVGYRAVGGGSGSLGIVLEEPKDYTSGRFRMTLIAGGAESDTYWPVPDDTPFEFDLSYDPVTKVLSGTINGQFATTADNGTVGSFSVDAFGVFDTSSDSRSQYFDFAFDDLEYTLPAVSVGFETASSGALESVSPAALNVVLAIPQENTVTVDYAIGGGSATNGEDYILTPGTLTFEPCDVNEIISIEIINDGNDEEDETIVITLSNPNGVELGAITQHTYTIIDPRPDVGFTTTASSGVEESLPATIHVSLSHPSNENVTVEYSVVGGTATGGGVDYNLPAGTLVFEPCEVTKYISIEIVEDACDEGSETIELILSDPNSAKLGDPCQHTYTIRDVHFKSFADSHTVALWLFDEVDYPHTTLTDASEYEKADMCLMDGGNMVTGKYGNALSISGGDYAVCYAGFAGKVPEEELREADGTPSGLWGPTEGSGALLNGLAGDAWTIELWLNLSAGGSGISIIDMGWAYDPGLSLTLNGSSLELVNYYAGVQATCPTGLSTGAWHHVAFTRDGSTVRHFYDGAEQTTPTVSSVSVQPIPDLQIPTDREHESRGFENMDFEERRQNRFNFAIGSDRHAGNAATGMIDEMRISDVVRYSSNFTPESFSRNYGPGAPGPSVINGPELLFPSGSPNEPVQIGSRKHVFIDDAIIDAMPDLQITMNQPYGKQAISKDFSIEKSAWRTSVFDVDGVVYMAIPEGYGSANGKTYLATSPDGLDFTMQGTIIAETPMYGSFFRDLNPNVTPEEQYKVNAFVANRGMYMYVSPDGLNWRRNETIQLPLRSGGEGECFWDDQHGRYASYLKRDSSFDDPDECADASGRVAVGFWSDEILKAWPFYHMVTPYFEGYPFPSVTCEGPVEFDVTAATQVYRTRAIKYPWAPDVYLAFVWRYPGDDNPRHVDLGISRDGENWSFFGTNWYIPLGSEEEELSMYGLIRRGDEIWQYVDEGGAHGGSAPRYYYRYRQRLDGFVSLDAGGTTGTAITRPLVFQGNKLVLNIAAAGSAKVAICNEFFMEIPGFGLSDCNLIQADSVEHVVTWNGDWDVSSLAGTVVRLKFQMQNTKLYAFQFRYLGDIDGSGVVDWADIKALGDEWLNDCAGPGWCSGCDINQDYTVDFEDYGILGSQWREGSP